MKLQKIKFAGDSIFKKCINLNLNLLKNWILCQNYMCMCIYKYVHIYVCVCMHIMYLCMYIYVYVYMHKFIASNKVW